MSSASSTDGATRFGAPVIDFRPSGLLTVGRTETMKILRSNRCLRLLPWMLLHLAAAATAIPRQGGGMRTGLSEDPLKPTTAAEIPRPPMRAVPDEWVPPDIDARQPPGEEGIAGPLGEVVSGAEARVEEFLDNLNRVTATESVQ